MKTIEDFRKGKLLKQKELQTGEEKGSFSIGDPHPFVKGLFYKQWHTGGELWTEEDNINKFRKQISAHNKTEKGRLRTKRYKQTDKYREQQRRNSNTPARRASQKRYQQSPKGKANLNHNNMIRSAHKKKATACLTFVEKTIIKHFYKQRLRLKEKLGIDFHVDHIVPLSLGGLHHPSNLQVVPARWNQKKYKNNTDQWLPNGL